MEMEMDRHLNSFRLGGDIISSASSACATPKLRAISGMASRGNSISPYAGGVASGVSVADGDSRLPPPPDSFLLPSSSFGSNAPTMSVGHPEAYGVTSSSATACPTGMVVGGEGGAVPPVSSSSIRINTSISKDEATASSEGTPHTTRLQVQDTSRMAAPRPVASAESTPRRTPVATPQLSVSHAPAA